MPTYKIVSDMKRTVYEGGSQQMAESIWSKHLLGPDALTLFIDGVQERYRHRLPFGTPRVASPSQTAVAPPNFATARQVYDDAIKSLVKVGMTPARALKKVNEAAASGTTFVDSAALIQAAVNY